MLNVKYISRGHEVNHDIDVGLGKQGQTFGVVLRWINIVGPDNVGLQILQIGHVQRAIGGVG